MKCIDLAIQTLLMLTASVVLIASFFYEDLRSLIAVDQFFLGVWQVAGCVIYLTVDPGNNGYRKAHLLTSFVYILSLLIFGGFLDDVFEGAFALYFFVPSWSLGVYYYFITIKTAFPRTGHGKFLPHLGF
jgi:hypothetical protein